MVTKPQAVIWSSTGLLAIGFSLGKVTKPQAVIRPSMGIALCTAESCIASYKTASGNQAYNEFLRIVYCLILQKLQNRKR